MVLGEVVRNTWLIFYGEYVCGNIGNKVRFGDELWVL